MRCFGIVYFILLDSVFLCCDAIFYYGLEWFLCIFVIAFTEGFLRSASVCLSCYRGSYIKKFRSFWGLISWFQVFLGLLCIGVLIMSHLFGLRWSFFIMSVRLFWVWLRAYTACDTQNIHNDSKNNYDNNNRCDQSDNLKDSFEAYTLNLNPSRKSPRCNSGVSSSIHDKPI